MRHHFTRAATGCARVMGEPLAFLGSCLIVIVWAAVGPLFHFSDTWQLVINTGTTVVTFLMVFLVQHTQNRDATAMHVKLDEIIRALEAARNTLIRAEEFDADQLERIKRELGREAT